MRTLIKNLCFFEIFSRKQQALALILRILSQILIIKSSSIISITFSKCCLKFYKKFQKNYIPTNFDLNIDKEQSTIYEEDQTTEIKTERFETTHNYEDNKDIEMKINMPNATEIIIEFDPRCATEQNTDYLQIYDRAEGGSLVTKNLSGPSNSQNWPTKIIIQSDSCRLFFHSDESNNDWGILCIISANILKQSNKFEPNYLLSMINLICYSIGKSLKQSLISFPMTKLEKEFKILLDLKILKNLSNNLKKKIIYKYEKEYYLLINNISNIKTNTVIRSKSESKFINDINTLQTVSQLLENYNLNTLINELTSNELDNLKPANLLLQILYKSQHSSRIKPFPLSLLVERFVLASFILQLDLFQIVLTTLREYIQFNANSTGIAKPPIPIQLLKLVPILYNIRTNLFFAYQKSKQIKRNLNNLRENDIEFAKEMLLKSKFLLLTKSLLNGKECYDENKYKNASNSLLTFIISNIKLIEIKNLLKIKEKRAKIRIKAMNIIKEFLSLNNFTTSTISFLSSLIDSFQIFDDKSLILTITNDLIDKYNENYNEIETIFIKKLTNNSTPNSLRLFLLRILLYPKKNKK